MGEAHLPPHYILLSQTTLPAASSSPSLSSGAGAHAISTTPTPALTFPLIHYHYADDPPVSLVPSSKGKDSGQQHYIILDYDPHAPHAPFLVRSISDGLAVVGVKVTEAPGIGRGVDEERNTSMYVIETVCTGSAARTQGTTESQQDWLNDPVGAVARFKQRNSVLREVLDYPERHMADTLKNQGGPLNPASAPSHPAGGDHGAAPDSASPASSPETMRNVPLGPG